MKITILVEGKTEMAFKPHLRAFLQSKLQGRMPRLDMFPYDGRIPKDDKLKRIVERLLTTGSPSSDSVIALTDVYTGSDDFLDAADAKAKMSGWVGPNDRFHPHAAQHDFEAWLLPYWGDIQQIAGHNRNPPSGPPESVNHTHPPSYHIKGDFSDRQSSGKLLKTKGRKPNFAGQDLAVAASQCPELKAFLNTVINLCGGTPI